VAAPCINAVATGCRLDKRPILPGCPCYTCQNHNRAYIHHLLQCHEMLASVLLETHNLHRALLFFAALRDSIAGGSWAVFRARCEAVLGAAGMADGAIVADCVVTATAARPKNTPKQDPSGTE
jgi:tRNA-guanine family transglycosylase